MSAIPTNHPPAPGANLSIITPTNGTRFGADQERQIARLGWQWVAAAGVYACAPPDWTEADIVAALAATSPPPPD